MTQSPSQNVFDTLVYPEEFRKQPLKLLMGWEEAYFLDSPKEGFPPPATFPKAKYQKPRRRRNEVLRILDPMCGCGGNTLGMHYAMPEAYIIGVDIAKWAIKTHHVNQRDWSDGICADAKYLPIRDNYYFDIISGGPPCQGFSIMNKWARTKAHRKAAESDPTTRAYKLNNLVFVFSDIITRHRPAAFFMENVPGMLSFQHLCFELLDDFEAPGYYVQIMLLNASDYGVPQTRERVFWFGSLKAWPTPPQPTHYGFCPKCGCIMQCLFYHAAPWFIKRMYVCIECQYITSRSGDMDATQGLTAMDEFFKDEKTPWKPRKGEMPFLGCEYVIEEPDPEQSWLRSQEPQPYPTLRDAIGDLPPAKSS